MNDMQDDPNQKPSPETGEPAAESGGRPPETNTPPPGTRPPLTETGEPAAESGRRPPEFGEPPFGSGEPPPAETGGQPTEQPVQQPADRPAPPTGNRPRTRFLALFVVIGFLLAVLAGFGGGYFASRYFAPPAVTTTTPTGTGSTQSTGGTQSTNGSGDVVTEVARIAGPSVVVILTETLVRGQNIPQYVASGAGSGIVYAADGLIVTNEHVVDGAQRIIVQLTDDSTYTATVVGQDEQMDLAVLRISATGLTPARIGDSSRLSVGDTVVAIGNPLGELGGTVTNGIVSALDRPITLDNVTRNLLQTNAAVNPGNSGGGLFDRNGTLIGIVEAKTSALGIEGIAFAIPINAARPVIDELIDHGYVRGRIALGMSLVDIDTQQELRFYRVPQLGLYVLNTETGGSAASAGLQSGDCILAAGDTQVSTTADLNRALEDSQVGDTVQITVLRDSQRLTLNMTLQEDRPG